MKWLKWSSSCVIKWLKHGPAFVGKCLQQGNHLDDLASLQERGYLPIPENDHEGSINLQNMPETLLKNDFLWMLSYKLSVKYVGEILMRFFRPGETQRETNEWDSMTTLSNRYTYRHDLQKQKKYLRTEANNAIYNIPQLLCHWPLDSGLLNWVMRWLKMKWNSRMSNGSQSAFILCGHFERLWFHVNKRE